MAKVWCQRHEKLLRRRCPDAPDAALASARLMELYGSDKRVNRMIGMDPTYGSDTFPLRLLGILDAWGPACCFLGDVAVNAVLDTVSPPGDRK